MRLTFEKFRLIVRSSESYAVQHWLQRLKSPSAEDTVISVSDITHCDCDRVECQNVNELNNLETSAHRGKHPYM